MSGLIGGTRSFLEQETGLETVEYAVITTMIVAVIVVALGALMLTIGNLFGEVADALL